MKFAECNPALLQPNPWNTNVVSPDMEKKLDESLKRLAMFKPIIVRELPSGKLEIIGGAHRAESAIRLKLKTVPIYNLGPIDDKKAKEIGLIDNGRYGVDDAVGLAELLADLGNPDELTTFMPFSDAEMTAIFSATKVDLDDLDLDADPDPSPPVTKNPPTHTIMRFKVPLGDAEYIEGVIQAVMKSQGLTGSDDLTNAGDALVHFVRAANS